MSTEEKEIKKQIGKELLPIFFIGPIIGCALAFVYSITFFKGSSTEDVNFIIKCDLFVFTLFLIIQIPISHHLYIQIINQQSHLLRIT